MKKYFVILMVLLALVAFSSSAFAAVTVKPDATTEIGGAAFVPSTGVWLAAVATSTEYAAQSKHKSGNKMYGTLNTDSDMKVDESVAVGDDVKVPTSATALNGTFE